MTIKAGVGGPKVVCVEVTAVFKGSGERQAVFRGAVEGSLLDLADRASAAMLAGEIFEIAGLERRTVLVLDGESLAGIWIQNNA